MTTCWASWREAFMEDSCADHCSCSSRMPSTIRSASSWFRPTTRPRKSWRNGYRSVLTSPEGGLVYCETCVCVSVTKINRVYSCSENQRQ